MACFTHNRADMLYIVAAILIGWTISGWTGFRWAGYPEKVVWGRHPAAACADFALSGHRFLEVAIMVLALLACLAGCVLLPDAAVFLCEAVILFLIIPLPYYFFDAARRDHRLRSFEFVHFNVLTPPTTHQERESLDGRLVDVGPPLVFFISEKQWAKKKYISDTDKKYLATFMVAPGLYVTKATNDILQTFDSLNLYEHILNPENAPAVEAFRNALKDCEDLRIRLEAMRGLSQADAPPASQPPPVTKKAKPATPAPVETPAPAVAAPTVAPQAPEPELEPEATEEQEDIPPDPDVDEDINPALARPATVQVAAPPVETSAATEGRTLGITPPDVGPNLPQVPGMTQMVEALNTPEKHKGARKTRKKKADPTQESLGLGAGTLPPTSDNSVSLSKND